MASEIKKVMFKIGIHTPRDNKYKTTLKLLKILERYGHLTDRIFIDHCSIDTISMVLKRGYTAGITLCPSKTKINELLDILYKFENMISKIMCNADNGGYFFDVIESKNILDRNSKSKLFFKNAAYFFKLRNPI